MRIAFNLLPYMPGKQGGAEIYIRNIINEISKMTNSKDEFYLFINKDAKGKYGSKEIKEIVVPWGEQSRLKRIFAEQLILPFYIRKYNIDVTISNYVAPILGKLLGGSKQVSIIHDMQYKVMPQMFEKSKLLYWRLFIPLTLKVSSRVGAVSEFSRSEIIRFFPKVKPKTFVTVEGVRKSLENSNGGTSKGRENFILSVLSFGKHKNLSALIDAFILLKNKAPNAQLKLVGDVRNEFDKIEKKKLLERIKENNMEANIAFLGYVSDEKLQELYATCGLYVFPSLYEGFGLPVIEAQENKAPVVCSDIASLPEIGGNAAIYFDPNSPEDIAQKMLQVMTDDGLKEELVSKGLNNVKKYTWKKATIQVLDNTKNYS